jgi:lipoprotein-anchoring transpeptidase ErfK/SrfK
MITAKRRNPTWVNPWADWSQTMPASIGPGPNNPLGTRALNISASGIRIHGTPDAASIGGPASHGCIRMHMHDAEALFELVDVGTPVVIVGS